MSCFGPYSIYYDREIFSFIPLCKISVLVVVQSFLPLYEYTICSSYIYFQIVKIVCIPLQVIMLIQKVLKSLSPFFVNCFGFFLPEYICSMYHTLQTYFPVNKYACNHKLIYRCTLPYIPQELTHEDSTDAIACKTVPGRYNCGAYCW